MRYLVNSREMRQYDSNTIDVRKVPALLLMEQAALAACEEIEKIANKSEPLLIVCGVGNNGGDGLAIGRILFLKGFSVELVLVGDEEKATEQNKKQKEILSAYGITILKEIPANKQYQMVIDAVFGVGLTRNVEGVYKTVIEDMNRVAAYKVAIDIPSGISADNGAILGVAFKADMTITFAFDKVGLHLWPGNTLVGHIIIKEIGITEQSFLENKPEVMTVEDSDLDEMAVRPSHSNKGTFGKLLIIAGSENMAGAAILAGKSAYASGCGLVRILTPETNRMILQTSVPEAILTTYVTGEDNLVIVNDAVAWADVILIGPGIGMSDTSERILKQVLKIATVPIVLDADALNLLAKEVSVLKTPHGKMVVTPHMGEMSRLTGHDIKYLQEKLIEIAKEFANIYDVTCVLKDERTIVSVPNGKSFVNLSGNAGMATAGSGDVLAGMIASFMAQGMPDEKAAPFAVYLHGAAGDNMVKETGKAGLMASDLIEGVRKILGCKER
ncbi:MAG: NAD(P)H-hydrate dehydratase [Roseburia sp.]|nr:NAD(P)H-hydrate dehydratase [Roseburia sp.]